MGHGAQRKKLSPRLRGQLFGEAQKRCSLLLVGRHPVAVVLVLVDHQHQEHVHQGHAGEHQVGHADLAAGNLLHHAVDQEAQGSDCTGWGR